MARSDNYMESGMSSAATRRVAQQQRRRQDKEEESALQVAPSAEIIMAWIDEELDTVCDMRHMVLHIADKELARDELLAVKRHMDFLEKLKGRAQKTLRVADRADKAARRAANKQTKVDSDA